MRSILFGLLALIAPGQALTFWATSLKNTFVAQVTAYQEQALTNSAVGGCTPINPQ